MTTRLAAAPAVPAPTVDAGEPALVSQAVDLAATLAGAAAGDRRRAERSRRRRLGRLIDDPASTRFVVELTDAVLRVDDHRRAARLFADVVRRHGVPGGFSPFDRAALVAGARLAPRLPRIVMPLVQARVRAESAGVVLPAEDPALARHVDGRRHAGIDLNLNVLGEAILGEEEAQHRLDAVRATLARPDVDYVSVKVSAVASHLDPVAFDDGVDRVCERLRPLFADAAAHTPPKFVNLDMEEYKDLDLTVAAFTRLLDEPALLGLEAGIVLQAYLPDSHAAVEHLTAWAIERRRRGGAGIKVRLVKGANLAMERVEAELHGWTAATYATKADVDASYKRMVDWCLRPEHTAAVRVGVASHNLFDVAWALTLADARGVADRVEIEMLEGMAPAEARAVRRRAGRVLLYAPVTQRRDFANAVAYLVRRLDENTTRGNYLREAFTITPGSPEFACQADLFRSAVADRVTLSTTPRRGAADDGAATVHPGGLFANEPDTDFAVAVDRVVVLTAMRRWQHAAIDPLPLVIAGVEVHRDARQAEGIDPSTDVVRYRYSLATSADVDRAVASARHAGAAWGARTPAERAAVLDAVADVMSGARAETIGALVLDGGKTVMEADVEVSEAIDFARYYGRGALALAAETAPTLAGSPIGPVVVTPPWNFPYAIPAGGVLAALAAGNPVILKPAPQVVLASWVLANQLWQGGVPRGVLQFLPCPDDEVGRRLVAHPDVSAVILTGARETADLFRSWRPDLHLLAETSGKNALVITAAADVEAAVSDLVRSAFGHAGQKCSAASVAIVEASVYDSPVFRRQLRDAVTSLRVGSAWDPATALGPLIGPPGAALTRALTTLEVGETWLVEPQADPVVANLWSPGVKLGVAPGSFFHLTECFGPVLGVMRAPDLDAAIAWQNATAFGLTGGIASLDVDEVNRWCERVEVGNAYVNRGTTGAVVQRQPFGGWKASAVGPGAKAGGPNYLVALQRWTVLDAAAWDAAAVAASAHEWWTTTFAVGHDPSGLVAERNVLRYRPLDGSVLVLVADSVRHDAGALAVARQMAGRAGTRIDVVRVNDQRAIDVAVASGDVTKVRVIGEIGAELRAALGAAAIPVDDAPVVPHGRIELLRWVREQAVSVTTHRYGNVGAGPVPDLGPITG